MENNEIQLMDMVMFTEDLLNTYQVFATKKIPYSMENGSVVRVEEGYDYVVANPHPKAEYKGFRQAKKEQLTKIKE